MSEYPLVSVIVTVFNSGEFLPTALRSLAEQDLEGLQIIIVNDGSPDRNDRDVATAFVAKTPNSSYIEFPENRGTGAAREAGIAAASGEYIGFLDSDDYALPHAFSTLYRKAKEHDCDIAISNFGTFLEDKQLSRFRHRQDAVARFNLLSGLEVFHRQIKKQIVPFYLRVDWWNKIYRRSLFVDHCITFPPVARNEGTMSMIMSLLASKVVIVDDKLLFNRTRQGSVSRSTSHKHVVDLLASVRHLRHWLIKLGHFQKFKDQYVQFFFYIIFNDALSRICAVADAAQRETIGRALIESLYDDKVIYAELLSYLNTSHRRHERAAYARALRGEFDSQTRALLAKTSFLEQKTGGSRTWYSASRVHPVRPLVSVITITKDLLANGRKQSMERAAASVVAQDYGTENIEHIIIDGASRDGTVAFLDQLSKQKKIEFFISERDAGIYNAMNKGFTYSRGDYILFLNSDDYLAPSAIGELVGACHSKEADYAFADAVKVDQQGKVVGAHMASLAKVYFGSPYCHQALLVARHCFNKIEYDETFRLTMWPYAYDLFVAGFRHAYVPKMLVAFTVGGLSTETQVDRFKMEQQQFRDDTVSPALSLSIEQGEFLSNVVHNRNNADSNCLNDLLEAVGRSNNSQFTRSLAEVLLERSTYKFRRQQRLSQVEWL